MDVFKFINPEHATLLDQGELINKLTSKLWIERYRNFGEFEFTANAGENMHLILPIGTLVSHIETDEVMIVENHEINDEAGKEPEIKITGRSFETYLENRIVGANKTWPTIASANEDFVIGAAYSWHQAVFLVKDSIDSAFVVDPDDALEHVDIITTVPGVSDSVERVIKKGELYSRLIDLLSVDNLGIKVMRPGVRSPMGVFNDKMLLVVYAGEDLSREIAFSYHTGEIENAGYLWSNKKNKNAAFVTSRWFETVVKNDEVGLDRRMIYIEATDLDNGYSEAPIEPDRSNILFWMFVRGQAALMAQKDVGIIKAETIRDSITHKYRENYDVGDIVTVAGQYNETTVMRISEYVEIEDETGQSGYPTLSAL